MPIELTAEQLRAIDALGETPSRCIDPRTQTYYLLIPEVVGPDQPATDESTIVTRAFVQSSMRAMARRLSDSQ